VESKSVTLKVIGTGFGRTGTDSMREALNMLGFGPCHHMYEVIANERQKALWRALAQGVAPDWNKLFAGYLSCMDWPSAHYWPKLIQAYPEAKVILTYRTPESWWTSVEKTLLAIANQVFGGRPRDRAHAISVYEANVRAVKAVVPPDRLLVHNLGDGWEPLCAHLGAPIPDQPYPSRNSAGEFRATHSKT
jgi:hypothetical protein